MPQLGELVLLVSPKGKRYLRTLAAGEEFHSNDGHFTHEALGDYEYGQHIPTHLGRPYKILKPTLHDLVKGVKRQTQIIYPKDIGYICVRLGVGPGRTVIEAGSGSGSLTVAMSWFSGETGKILTYEARPEFFKLCRRNLNWAGMGQNVEQFNHDIADGFLHTGADALFLDVRTPWEYLDHVAKAVAPGAPCGFLLPTVSQVSMLLEGLQDGPFDEPEVIEILLRRWKPVPDRLRPNDRMVAHTGFLVFCRHEEKYVPPPKPEPEIEPEPKTDAEADVPDTGAPETPDAPEPGDTTPDA